MVTSRPATVTAFGVSLRSPAPKGINRNADRFREKAIEIAEEIWVPSAVISSEWLEQALEGTAMLRCRRLPFEQVRSGWR